MSCIRSIAHACAATVVAFVGLPWPGAVQADWPSAGHDLGNSRSQPTESRIGPLSASTLRLRWSIDTSGDVTAHPATDDEHLYFPDSEGWLYKVRKIDGTLVWKRPISDYTGIAGDWARATPAISGRVLVLGNQSGKRLDFLGQPAAQGAHVFGVDKETGARLWSTRVDATRYSMVTQSAVIARGMAFVGVASNEEVVAGFLPKSAFQFAFRGSVVALDVRTGRVVWRTMTVPPGYAGGSVWGSTPVVDLDRNQLYVGSGNNHAVPAEALACLHAGGTPASCLRADNWADSLLALDLASGAIRWAQRALPYDAWNLGCGINVPGLVLPPNDQCPQPAGPDWDFAQGPMLIGGSRSSNEDAQRTAVADRAGQVLGMGQKSGKFWAWNPANGALLWVTQAGPPGLSGGLQWGSANDGRRIYVAVANSGPTSAGQQPLPWTLKDASTTTAGGWAALDARSGAVLWTTRDPQGSRSEAPVSVANGVVFGCNMDAARGTFYALDAASGSPLWSFDSGGACTAGATVDDGMVFWGSGTFSGVGPRRLHAFSLP